MKTAKLLFVLCFMGWLTQVTAQCPNDNTFLMNATPPASPGVSSMTVNCMNGGQYVTTGVIAGNVYTFTTCGNTAFDTQITVLNTATSALIGYNDDACGLQSTVTWTATFTGNVNVLIDQFPCANTGLCTTLVITSTPPVQSGTGCNTNTTICTPGVAGPFGFSTPGPPVSTCLDFFGPNYAYIVLYITTSGPLQMLINGSATTGFLDVAIFNVPAGVDPCVAALNDANQIACNYASAAGGCNQIGTNFPCTSSVPSPNVVVGQVLFIVVENWSGTSNNFTLQLGPPPAAQTGPPNGTVNPAGPFCASAAPVQLTAVNSGGTWSGPGVSSTGMFNPATAGIGTHTINYAIGSAPCVGSGSTTITVSPMPAVNAVPNQTLCANTSTTAINFTGTAGATYNWTNSNTAIGLGASGSGNIPSFTATNATGAPITSTITVTPSLNGCTGTPITFTITVNPLPTVNAVTSQTRCANALTAAVNFSGSMGTATYNWTNSNPAIGLGASGSGNIGAFIATNATGAPISGTITVTPTANGCAGTPITFSYTINPVPTVNAITSQTLCAGISTTAINISGNVATATYNWTNSNTAIGLGASGSSNIGAFTSTNGTGSAITGTITVTPTANGCSGTPINFTITVNLVGNPSFTATSYCAGSASPAATITGSTGGTFSFNPVPGGGVTINPTTGSITGGVGGSTYTVQYTTSGACPQSSTQAVSVYTVPVVTAADVSICAGGTVTITANGASTYSWNNGLGAGQSHNVTPASTTTYNIIGTSINGCTNTATMTLTVTATAPINAGPDVTICNGTPTTLTATGGVTYNWIAPISAAGAIQTVSPSATTTYTVNGTDAAGCTGTDTVVVTVNAIPTVNPVTSQTLCANTATTAINFSGSIGASAYNWTNSNTAIGLGASGSGNIPSFTATNATGSAISGSIVVTPTANGCAGTPINFSITANPVPVVNGVSSETLCAGGATTAVNFTGSVGSAIYNWTNSNPSIGLGASGAGNIGPFTATNASVSPITGTITITPTANGCAGVSTNLTITVNPLPSATISGSLTVCQNDPSPAVTFTGMSGTAPYTFTYTLNGGGNQTIVSNGAGVATINAPTGVAGTFDYDLVSVQDASSSSCSQTQGGTASIIVNLLPTATVMGTASVCLGGTNPTVTFTGANGTAPFIFTYNVNGAPNQTLTSLGSTATISVPTLAAGVFNFNLVSLTDASVSGCIQNQAGVAIVTVNALPIVFAGNDFSICGGDQIVLTGSGASSYGWDQGGVDGVPFIPVATNTYAVTGTDVNGCVNTDNITVTVEVLPVLTFDGINLSGCAPLAVTLTNTTQGAVVNCVWTLENGDVLNGCGSVTAMFNSPGTYDVTLTTTSATGCASSATYTDYVFVQADPIASFSPNTTAVTNYNSVVYFDNTSSGAVTYDWNFGDGSQTIHTESPNYEFPGDQPGTYIVQLIAYSSLGCTDTAYSTIQLAEELIFFVPNSFTPDIDDYNPTFQPIFTTGFDPYDFTLLLFNRWGEIIFESHNAEIGWDGTYGGKLVQDGTYTWKIEFKTTVNDERKSLTGHVNLIR